MQIVAKIFAYYVLFGLIFIVAIAIKVIVIIMQNRDIKDKDVPFYKLISLNQIKQNEESKAIKLMVIRRWYIRFVYAVFIYLATALIIATATYFI